MAAALLERAVRRTLNRVRTDAEPDDADLVARFCRGRDPAAFAGLVRRHGPAVLATCRRVLGDHHAAEDAFQAAFLVLARKASAVRPPGAVGAWLHGVAYRTALKARGRTFRRRAVEAEYAATRSPVVAGTTADATDLRAVLDEHLNALPARYRLPLVLCGVQGLGKAEAAVRLGLPEGTVSSRLARGRELLRGRLTRRGVIVPAAGGLLLLPAEALLAAVPPGLAAAVSKSGVGFVAGSTTGIGVGVLSLTHEVLRTMSLLHAKTLTAVVVSAVLAGGGAFALKADEPKKPAAEPGKPKVGADGQKPKAGADGGKKPGGDGDKPKGGAKDGDKPKGEAGRRPSRVYGKVVKADASARTITVAQKGEGGLQDVTLALAADAKVVVDGKPADLAAVSKAGTGFAEVTVAAAKDGVKEMTASEVRVGGPRFTATARQASDTSLTVADKTERVVKLAAGGRVTVDGKEAKLSDVKAGSRVVVQMTTDETAALSVSTLAAPEGDGKKPVKKPDGEKGNNQKGNPDEGKKGVEKGKTKPVKDGEKSDK